MNWNLSVYYKGLDDPALLSDLKGYPAASEALRAKIVQKEPLEVLTGDLERYTNQFMRLSYIQLVLSVDAHSEKANAYMRDLLNAQLEYTLTYNAFTRHLNSLDNLDELIENTPALQPIAFFLQNEKKNAAHLIAPELERWILRMSISGGEAFSELRDKLDATLLIKFDDEPLPLSAIRAKAYDADAATRRKAYEAEIAAYDQIALPMSYSLNNIKAEGRTMAEAKNYPDILTWTLGDAKLSRETLDVMLEAIKESLPHFRRYLRKKGELLGHDDGLPFYDLFAPLGEASRTYTAEEAREILVRELGKFNPAMGEFVNEAYDNHLIDMYPRIGKRGGAFCAPNHEFNVSHIMTNFAGSFSAVSTLAHELGHAWNARCMEGLSTLMTDTPMPLAETASIFNETVLSHAVQENASDAELITLLENDLQETTQTIVDIYSRYLFETAVINADHPLSVDELKQTMLDAQDASYGDGLDKDVRHPFMWACKRHYYTPTLHFYNFPYAFGYLFGKGLFARYLKEGESFVPQYDKLL